MKTLNLYAIPVALLVLAGGTAVQSASAEPESNGSTFEARFVFNPADPAEKIYTDIKRTAERYCETPGPRPLSLMRLERACTQKLMAAAVERISRKDVADVHNHGSRG